MKTAAHTISLRDERADGSDEPFFAAVYADVRREEVAQSGWPEVAQAAFLADQAALQAQHYRRYYPGAQFSVIEADGRPIGRLFIHRTAKEHRLMDIALLRAWRSHGIGSALMAELLTASDAASLPMTLHVERFNPAYRLYLRLGFSEVEERGIYVFMQRPVGGQG